MGKQQRLLVGKQIREGSMSPASPSLLVGRLRDGAQLRIGKVRQTVDCHKNSFRV